MIERVSRVCTSCSGLAFSASPARVAESSSLASSVSLEIGWGGELIGIFVQHYRA